MFRTIRIPLVALLLSVGSLLSPATAAERELDLDAWQHLPVLSGGRIMPLQTFAREAVANITGRENPTLDPQQELGERWTSDDDLAEARKLFPHGARKWPASELLLSWMIEPSAWEEVPFLLAEHAALREALGLEVETGKLRYVSPAQLMDSDEFAARIQQLGAQQQAAEARGEEFSPQGVDKQIAELARAFQQYRQLTTNTIDNPRARGRFLRQASQAVEAWSTVYEGLGGFHGQEGLLQLSQSIAKVDAAHQEIISVLKEGGFRVKEIEPAVVRFGEGARELQHQTTQLKDRLLSDPPAGVPQDRLENLQGTMTLLASKAGAMAKHAREMHLALYDEDYPLRIVPALNPAALERDRETEDDAQPWLAFQTVLYGSDQLLSDYPQAPLQAARRWYGEMAQAYTSRNDAERAAKFEKAAGMFAQALRNLGTEVEPLRRALPIQQPDEALLRYTQYPPAGYTETEVRYNEVQPFMGAWVISLLATVCFALAFGVLRKPMFWAGTLVLVAGLGWWVYGFYMRVAITQWAPVTNMYETVVYVPFFVCVLGAWFLLLPLTWTGVQAAWRATAFPFTRETAEPTSEQQDLMSAQAWKTLGLVAAVPRIALMGVTLYLLAFATIYDGGNTVLSLTPKIPFGQLLGNLNDLTVWLVGLVVLLSSVWFLPRVVLAAAAALVFIPWALKGRFGQAVAQVYPRWPFGLTATIVGFLGAFVAWWWPIPGKDFGPLQPVLRSNFWLTIHVLTIVSSYAAGALAWGLGNLTLGYFLFGRYRDPRPVADLPAGHRPAQESALGKRLVQARPPEQTSALANYCYKAMQVAVLLLAAGTILGGLWADVSWGRFWGWDPKEVFALVSLLVYLAVLHGRYAGWFGDFGMAVGTILGASAIIMSWYGVNFVLGVGLHAYAFGSGGQVEVAMCVAANWLFLGLASLRYWMATQPYAVNAGGSGTSNARQEKEHTPV